MSGFDDFHHRKIDFDRTNNGIVTSISKIDEANVIEKFMSICLLHVLFKIFTKTLNVRAEPDTGKLIHSCQTAFI
jgi:hypothetical protein